MKKEQMVFLASDHAGFYLKEKIKRYLEKRKIGFEDVGTFSDKDVDYPDYILPCAEKVAKNKNSFGIILGGSGEGETIAANKVRGIRAALYYGYNYNIIELSREHNNSNILCLGARFLTEKEGISAVKLWLKTKFSKEVRHVRRIKKIEKFENRR